MKIRTIRFYGHDVLGNLELDFTDKLTGEASDTVIIAGENGCGKTVLLEALFDIFSKHGPADLPKTEIHLELDDDNISEIKRKLGIKDELEIIPNIILRIGFAGDKSWDDYRFEINFADGSAITRNAYEYFEENKNGLVPFRVFLSDASVNFSTAPLSSVTAMMLDESKSSVRSGESIGKEISQLLVDIRSQDNEDLSSWVENNSGKVVLEEVKNIRIKRFRDAVAFIFPGKRFKSIISDGSNHKIQFEEYGRLTSLDQLSTGERQIIFRGGFVLRDLFSMQGGVLLIDEPELSLHPLWQSKIIGFYKRLFSNSRKSRTQLILATHSPFVVHDEDNSKVVILKKNESGFPEVDPEPSYPLANSARVAQCFNIGSLISKSDKDVQLLVEGETDRKIVTLAWSKLFPDQAPFFDVRAALSHTAIRVVLNDDQVFIKNPGKKLVGLFDFDSAFNEWNGTWKNAMIVESSIDKGYTKKHASKSGWAMLLPVPDFRAELASLALKHESVLSVEMLFRDEDHLDGMVERLPLPSKGAFKPKVRDSMKVAFAEHASELEPSSFESFRPIFDRLEQVRSYS